MLSHIDNTYERQPHNPRRKNYRCCDARFCKRPDKRIWDIYRKYADSRQKKQLIKTTVLISCFVCYLKYSQAASAATAPSEAAVAT